MTGRLLRLRRVGGLLRPYRWRIAGAGVAIIATTLASLAPPYLAGRAVDDVIKARSTETLDEIVAVMVGALVLGWVAGAAQTYLVGWVGQRALRDMRIRLFDHLQSLSVSFYERHSAGVLVSRLTNNVEDLDQLVNGGVNAVVSSLITLVGAFVILFVLDPELALVTVGVIPLLAAGTWVYGRSSETAYHQALDTIADVTNYMQESLSGVRVVRTFGQEERHRREFQAINAHNRDTNWRAISLITVYLPYVAMLSIVAIAVVALVGGLQVIDGSKQLGVVVAFIGYLQLALASLPDVASLYTVYKQGTVALDQSFELLEESPEVLDRPGARELPPVRGEVRLEDVSFGYSGERTVLTDVSLRIEAGEILAVVGATGAGKSTLMKLLLRFYDPTRGRVLVDGYDIREVTAASLRRQIGYVPQEPFLFTGSVRDNIAFARPDASDEEVEAAARSVGVLEVLRSLSSGLDTDVGEEGANLSSGQRQLVALARAALPDPRIVILDEATSGLDLATEDYIRKALARLLGGRTALIVAHRLSTVRGADRIVVVDAGRIAETGTHDELIAAGGEYSRLYSEWSESD